MNPTQNVFTIGTGSDAYALKNLTRIVPTEKLTEQWAKVPSQPQPSAEQAKILKMIDEKMGMAKAAKQHMHDKWNQGYLQYRSVNYYSLIYGGFPTYWNQWGMSVFIPRTFETIESVKTQMQGRVPDFSCAPTRPSRQQETYTIEHLTKSEYKRSKTQREVAETVHDVNLYGAGLVRVDFVNKIEQQHVLFWKEDGTLGSKESPVTTYAGVGSRRVDPYDFYPDPSPEMYRMDKDGFWCFERSVVDAWSLREQYRLLNEKKAMGVTDSWQFIRPGGDTTDYKYLRSEVDSLFISRNNSNTPGTVDDLIGRVGFSTSTRIPTSSKDKIEVWEYWEKDRYIVVTGTGLILRDSCNPYPHKQVPYVKYNLVEMNEFWGIGYPEMMKSLQIEENVLHDQGLNNIIMSVHKMFAVNSRYLEDEGELVARPFGIVHLKQTPGAKVSDAIMPIEYNMNMSNYFEFMRKTGENIQSVTGVSPFQIGGVSKESKIERATVANRLAFAGQARIREISRHMEDNLITGIVEQYIAIEQFYYQSPAFIEEGFVPIEVESPESNFFVKFVSKSEEQVTEEEKALAASEGYRAIIGSDKIQGRYTVIVSGGSSIAKDPEDLAALKMQFAQWASTQVSIDPATGQPMPMFDMPKINKEVAKDVFQVSNPDDYLYKKPENALGALEPTTPPMPVPVPQSNTAPPVGTGTPTI